MFKRLFVIKGEGEWFVVREDADHKIGDVYDGAQLVESMIILPEDADQLEGLMEIEEVEGLILHALDAAYNRGRLDERVRITSRIQRTLVGE